MCKKGEGQSKEGETGTAVAEGNATIETEQPKKSCIQPVIDFYWKYEFLCLVVIVILLARAYPPLGAEYLAPQITATWIAVVFIFGTYI